MDEPAQPQSEPRILGGNIELHGFSMLDGGSMIVLKKIIGNYARKFSDTYGTQRLKLHLSTTENKYFLSGSAHRDGSETLAEHADTNIFFLVDAVLKKLEHNLQ